MRKCNYFLAALAATASLTACSSHSTPNSHPTPTSTSVMTGAEAQQAGGPVTEQINKPFNVTDNTGIIQAAVTITAIRVDPQCTSATASPAANGHYIAVDMDVATTPMMGRSWGYPVDIDFSVTGPDGFTDHNVGAANGIEDCLPFGNGFNGPQIADTKSRGTVLLDSRYRPVSVVYRPHWFTDTSGFKIPVG